LDPLERTPTEPADRAALSSIYGALPADHAPARAIERVA
jgi:hypothetical protein